MKKRPSWNNFLLFCSDFNPGYGDSRKQLRTENRVYLEPYNRRNRDDFNRISAQLLDRFGHVRACWVLISIYELLLSDPQRDRRWRLPNFEHWRHPNSVGRNGAHLRGHWI